MPTDNVFKTKGKQNKKVKNIETWHE